MNTQQLTEIAENANLIDCGYAMTVNRERDLIRVLNLHRPTSSAVFDVKGQLIETSMDDIELVIVQDRLKRDMKYLELEGGLEAMSA